MFVNIILHKAGYGMLLVRLIWFKMDQISEHRCIAHAIIDEKE